MKRFFTILTAVFMILMTAALCGCNQNTADDGKINVVCTIFPQHDWTREILGDNPADIELTLLLDDKVDLHSYQPTVSDIARISSCDLFIYVGGESDKWAEDVLKEAVNKDMKVINLLSVLGGAAKTEEIKEGMEAAEHDHDHEEKDLNGHEGEAGYDEHVWLSLKNARVFCAAVAEALSSLDADNAEIYRRNLTAYSEKLSALDTEYQAAADNASVNTLLFGDRFPFRYLTEDYGLDYYAAFTGCSAETEADFHTIVFLAGKADELGLKSIMVTESSDQSIARTIKDNTLDKNQQILVLNAMQSVTREEVKDGESYIGIMKSNLDVLKAAL